MGDVERLIKESRPKLCPRCLGRLAYVDAGSYRCQYCGRETLDDYGKMRQLFEQSETVFVNEIIKTTDINKELIRLCTKDGKLVLPEEKYTLKCKRCGYGIPSGRYCQKCKNELAGGIRAMLNS